MNSKHPAASMVLRVLSSYGHVMPSPFMKAGHQFNKEEYWQIMSGVLIPWIIKYYEPQQLMSMQNSSPTMDGRKYKSI